MATEVQTAKRLRVFLYKLPETYRRNLLPVPTQQAKKAPRKCYKFFARGQNVTSQKAAILVHITVLACACLYN